MHSHKAEQVDKLFKEHLPHGYASQVVEIAKTTGRIIKQVSVRQIKIFYKSDIIILNLLIELALKNKAVAEAEAKKLNNLLKTKIYDNTHSDS